MTYKGKVRNCMEDYTEYSEGAREEDYTVHPESWEGRARETARVLDAALARIEELEVTLKDEQAILARYRDFVGCMPICYDEETGECM